TLFLTWSAETPAQVYTRPGGPTTPPYSPYLNLLRPGNPAINYYGLVRPQFDFRQQIQGLQQLTAPATLEAQTANTLPTTGHPVQFLNYSHYFGGAINRPGAVRPGAVVQGAQNVGGVAAQNVGGMAAPKRR